MGDNSDMLSVVHDGQGLSGVSGLSQVSAPMTAAGTISSQHFSKNPQRIFEQKHLQKLVTEVDPMAQLENDVEEVLLEVADDFLDQLLHQSCQLTRHRQSATLEVRDVAVALQRTWNMTIPGFSIASNHLIDLKLKETERRKTLNLDAHRLRQQLIRKTQKKA